MFNSYQNIFEKRGHLYHKAMTLYPLARMDEFNQIIQLADIKEGDIVYDIPSGGGYIRKLIDTSADIVCIETSSLFANLCRSNGALAILISNLHNLPIRPGSADKVISLAGLHHVSNKQSFYRESYRILKNDGVLCVADVWQHSGVSTFLDRFVNDHSSTGHKGMYIDETIQGELKQCGFNMTYSSLIKYFWRFDSLDDMADFCKLLFGLESADHEQILKGIQDYLGHVVIGGKYCVNWELFFCKAIKQQRSSRRKGMMEE